MTAHFELAGFSHWLQQPQQKQAGELQMSASISLACVRLDMGPQELMDMMDDSEKIDFMLMHLDNCVNAPSGDSRTLGEVYLKKRGWKDTALNRAYLEAAGASPLRLLRVHEVTETHISVVNALAPDEPVWVGQHEGLAFFPNDLIATRILNVRGKVRFAAGLFVFGSHVLDRIVEYLHEVRAAAVEETRAIGAPLTWPESMSEYAAADPAVFMNYWLEDVVVGSRTIDTAKFRGLFDGAYWRVSYTLAGGTSEIAVEAALAQLPGVLQTSPGRWRLEDHDPIAGGPDGSGPIEYAIVLVNGRLRGYAASGAMRDRLRDLFAGLDPVLFDGPPDTAEVGAALMGIDLVENLARQNPEAA